MHQSIMNPLNPRVNGRIWFLYPILYIDHVVKRINFKCKFHCYGYDQQMSMYNLCTMGIITGSLACVRTVKYKYATVCVDHSAVQQLNLSTQFTDTINAMVNCQFHLDVQLLVICRGFCGRSNQRFLANRSEVCSTSDAESPHEMFIGS